MFVFSIKLVKKDDISLELPRIQISNYNVERIPSIKFLGVLLDDIFYGKTTTNILKTKFFENIGILRKARDYLSKPRLLSLYYAHIHT